MRDFKVLGLQDVVRFHDYHRYPFKGLSSRIIEDNITNTDILYWEPLEPIDSPFSYLEDSFGHSEFSNLLSERNIKFFVVYSDYHIDTIQDYPETYIENVIIIKWKTSLLNYSRYSAESVYGSDILNIKIDDSNFKKLFNCLNRGVRPTRVFLLDYLYKLGLFSYGDISWNLLTTDEPFLDYNLKFKYWTEERLKLDLDESSKHDKEKVYDYHLWSDYYLNSNCLFTIQSESIVNDQITEKYFLSEKTWKPLLLGQPCLIIAPPGYYKYLQSFGFKLYDEIIDYSFDDILNAEDRIIKIVDEIYKLKDKDYNELYKKIKEKVEYNRNLAISITEKDEYVSDIFIQLYKQHKNKIDNIPCVELNMNLKQLFCNLK